MYKGLCAIFLTVMMGLSFQTTAQDDDNKINISASWNYTFTADFLNDAFVIAESFNNEVERASIPSLQFAIDYSIKNFFSLGLAASYQDIGFDVTNNEYFDVNGNLVTENYRSSFRRMSIALRPLFHYADNDELDMYSGLRIQYFRAFTQDDSNDPFVDGLDYWDLVDVDRVSVAVTLFGIRYFFTPNIGLGTEINLGRPYLINLNLNCRF